MVPLFGFHLIDGWCIPTANPHVAKNNLVFLLKAIDPWSNSSFRRVICHQLVTTPYPYPSYPFLGTLIHLMHCIVQKLPGRRLPPDFECTVQPTNLRTPQRADIGSIYLSVYLSISCRSYIVPLSKNLMQTATNQWIPFEGSSWTTI